jgi:hypothetical protein
MASSFGEWHHIYKKPYACEVEGDADVHSTTDRAPFGAQVAIERVTSALGWKTLGIVGNLGGDIRAFSEPGDMRFQVRLPLSPACEREP